jgi:hypothetical protein
VTGAGFLRIVLLPVASCGLPVAGCLRWVAGNDRRGDNHRQLAIDKRQRGAAFAFYQLPRAWGAGLPETTGGATNHRQPATDNRQRGAPQAPGTRHLAPRRPGAARESRGRSNGFAPLWIVNTGMT